MKIWTVTLRGEGFLRENSRMGFDLSGIVQAADPNVAFSRAVHLGKQQYSELAQAEKQEPPRPVINAEEIEEFNGVPQSEIDKVQIYWYVH